MLSLPRPTSRVVRATLCAALGLTVACAQERPIDDAPPTQPQPESAKTSARGGLGPQGPPVLLGAPPNPKDAPALAEAPPPPEGARPDHALLVAIDTPYQIFRGQGSYIHVAAWHRDGRPAHKARVYASGREVGRTDKHGTLVFTYTPDTAPNSSVIGAGRVTVVDAQDPSLRGDVPFSPQARTASFASDHLFVYTDRGAYRPGERVRLRLIGWHLEEDYAPLEEASIDVVLQASNGSTVHAAKRVTDAYGVAHLDIDLPVTAPEGLYTLKVACNGARAQARLQVKDFKPPVIAIEHTLGRFITRDQVDLGFDLTLRPTSGAIKRATVTVTGLARGRKAFAFERTVDGPGPHPIRVSKADLDALRKGLRDGQFATVRLDVKDDRGRTDRLDRELRYTANPYIATLEADKDQYTTEDPVTLVARVSDLDRAPLRNKALTLDAGTLGTLKATTDDAGMARFAFAMPAKTVTAKLHIQGVKAPIATTRLRWIQPRPMRSQLKDPIVRERAQARVVVHFPAGIIPAESVVHMDVVDTSGALVNAVLLPVKREGDVYTASGAFEAPSWGSMLLTFFALGRRRDVAAQPKKSATPGTKRPAKPPVQPQPDPDKPYLTLGLLTEGQNLVVQPDKTLTITLDGLPDTAQPGAPIDATVTVTDPLGKPVEASVGAALVDRRVLALKDPLEVTPMDHFYNPALRTMSTTGSKILSWPVVSRNWGGRIHDVALPPFPYLDGGPVRLAQGSNAPGTKTVTVSGGTGKAMAKPKSVKANLDALGYGGEGKGGGGGDLDFEDVPSPEPEPDAPPPPPAEAAMIQAEAKKYSKNGLSERRSRGRGARQTPKPTITIRTRFPDTALWAPTLTTNPQGATQVRATLPDQLADQELLLVASSKDGGVGVARTTVAVTQPVFTRLDLPPVLHAGETLQVPALVQNNTDQAADMNVTLTAPGQPTTERVVRVPARDSAIVALPLKAAKPGALAYTLTASGAGHKDVVQGKARVVPAGAPRVAVTRGQATAQAPFKATWTVPKDALGNDAYVALTFPSVTSAFLGLDALRDTVRDAPFALSSDLLSAALVLQVAARYKLSSDALVHLRVRVLDAAERLALAQGGDGAFRFWRNGQASPLVTAWTLEALLACLELDMPVSQQAITRAADWLTSQLDPKTHLIGVSDVAFWQGDTRAVRFGLTAEVFDVLAQVPEPLRSPRQKAALTALTGVYKPWLLKTPDPAPLAAGRAMSALARLGAITPDEARARIDSLLLRRDQNHWEPSWFHAYGGTIEATVAVLDAMHRVAPDGFQAEKRDALAYILSTRGAWGQWHNERGTAAALRALALVGQPPDAIAGVLNVRVDGKVVKTVRLDDKDPFMSTHALSWLDLGQHLPPGDHTVSIDYDGTLAPSVALTTRAWTSATAADATQGPLQLKLKAPAKATPGQPLELKITAGQARAGHTARLRIAPSGLVALDLPRLMRAVDADPKLGAVTQTPLGVEIELPLAAGRTTFTLPFEALQPGTGAWPTVALISDGTPSIAASAGTLTVAP